MSTKISRLSLRELWNSEYTLFVNQLVIIFAKYSIESLHLTKAFGRVTVLLPKLAKIKAQELSNIHSKKIQDLNNERSTLIRAIVNQVKTMGKLTLNSVAPHVEVLNRFFGIHGHDIDMVNSSSKTERLDDLIKDYDAKPNVQVSATALNLTIFFEQLRTVNTQFASLFLLRTAEESAVKTIDSNAIRTESDKALTAFFDAFEFCSSEFEELDYITPANEMNDLITYYKAQLKARITRRNSGKDVSSEKQIA